MTVEPLAVCRVADIQAQTSLPWLVEGLWVDQGVGILCGSPKTCKTWLALDLALSVASRTAALGTYPVVESGPVLLFIAEDSPASVRTRLTGIAAPRSLSLAELPIHLVMHRSLRLESKKDQARLRATVARYRPKLLVLDPFVRLTAIDENSSLEVSAVLAALRELQATFGVAILVVHHARKNGGGAAAGLALRGSGDFWAWGDSNLYLSRRQERLQLAVEHRSAPTPEPITLELYTDGAVGPYLSGSSQGLPRDEDHPRPLTERVLGALRADGGSCRLDELRSILRVRMQSVVDALRQLERDGLAHRSARGWSCGPAQTSPGETEAGSAGEQPAKG